MKILSAQVGKEDVRRSFSRAFSNRNKEIIRIEECRLVFYLFELVFRSSRKEKRIYAVCDALKGKVRRMKWPQPCHKVKEPPTCAALDEIKALKIVEGAFRWLSFSSGLRVRRKYHLVRVISWGKIAYPFWIIYYKKKRRYNFSVYDALSGKREDFFGREIFLILFGLRKRSA